MINIIKKVSLSEVYPELCQQIMRTDDADLARKSLHLLRALSSTVSFWRFQCNNFKDDCFKIAFEDLVGTYETY